jgi:hypothetical protein
MHARLIGRLAGSMTRVGAALHVKNIKKTREGKRTRREEYLLGFMNELFPGHGGHALKKKIKADFTRSYSYAWNLQCFFYVLQDGLRGLAADIAGQHSGGKMSSDKCRGNLERNDSQAFNITGYVFERLSLSDE